MALRWIIFSDEKTIRKNSYKKLSVGFFKTTVTPILLSYSLTVSQGHSRKCLFELICHFSSIFLPYHVSYIWHPKWGEKQCENPRGQGLLLFYDLVKVSGNFGDNAARSVGGHLDLYKVFVPFLSQEPVKVMIHYGISSVIMGFMVVSLIRVNHRKDITLTFK